MLNNKELSKEKTPAVKFRQYLRKNGSTILMLVFVGVLFVSPDAKSFVLRQLMATGLFNASMDRKSSDVPSANDFDFTDENGTVHSTASLRGKVVFINFWASWCPPCRAEFPSIETLYTRFKDTPDLFFLTINEDSDPGKGRAYLDKENFSVPLYTAYSNIAVEMYTGTLPTTLVLDKNGKIRLHHTGFANYTSGKFVKQIEELIHEP
jgi:thiol-disulfide isomerase/thioredoxin